MNLQNYIPSKKVDELSHCILCTQVLLYWLKWHLLGDTNLLVASDATRFIWAQAMAQVWPDRKGSCQGCKLSQNVSHSRFQSCLLVHLFVPCLAEGVACTVAYLLEHESAAHNNHASNLSVVMA